MSRLFLCLLLSAFTASLRVEFQWERTVRREWREFAQAAKSNAADLQLLSGSPLNP